MSRASSIAAGVLLIAGAALAPMGVYVGYHEVVNSRWFLVREVVVAGNQRVAQDDILRAAGLDRPRNVLTCDAERMAADIEALAWIRDAEVHVVRSGLVTIDVEETHHVATVMFDVPTLVDADGVAIRPWTEADGLDVPLLVGFDRDGDRVAPGAFRSALALVDALEAVGAPAPCELHHDRVNGFRALLDDGTEVRMGRDRFGERAARLMDVYGVLRAQGRSAEYVVLEGETLERVAVRLRDEATETAWMGASAGE